MGYSFSEFVFVLPTRQTTDTEERYALLPLLAVHSFSSLSIRLKLDWNELRKGRKTSRIRMAVGAHWGMVHCNIKVQFTEDGGGNLSISLAPDNHPKRQPQPL